MRIVYSSLFDIHIFENQLSHNFKVQWFRLIEIPELIIDYQEMIAIGKDFLMKKGCLATYFI